MAIFLPLFSMVDARLFDKDGNRVTRCWWCYFSGDPNGAVVKET